MKFLAWWAMLTTAQAACVPPLPPSPWLPAVEPTLVGVVKDPPDTDFRVRLADGSVVSLAPKTAHMIEDIGAMGMEPGDLLLFGQDPPEYDAWSWYVIAPHEQLPTECYVLWGPAVDDEEFILFFDSGLRLRKAPEFTARFHDYGRYAGFPHQFCLDRTGTVVRYE